MRSKSGSGRALHTRAKILGTLALILTLDGGTEGVGQAQRVEAIRLVLDTHLVGGGIDIDVGLGPDEVVGIGSDTELPIEERIG